jgi:hypothetical protein
MGNGVVKSEMVKLTARWALAAAACAAGAALGGCPPTGPGTTRPGLTTTRSADGGAAAPVHVGQVRWRTVSARHQAGYLRLDMPVISAGTRITVGQPVRMDRPAAPAPASGTLADDALAAAAEEVDATGTPAEWEGTGGGIQLYSARMVRGRSGALGAGAGAGTGGGAGGEAEGPLVDQLTGQPRVSADGGSFLVPLAAEGGGEGDGVQVLTVKDPMPVYARLTVPPVADPGEYRIPMRIEAPGRAAEEVALAVTVSEVALPTEPRVLGVVTTTRERLGKLFPDTIGAVTENYLDRGEAAHKEAVDALDGLVRAARREGVALFVEDLGPALRVDERGLITLDWDAYDRVMQPYMDGTAFDDRLPQPAWLAPVPPRRIRDSATQLWQYIDACAKHFAEKGWVATPAFLHPAVAEFQGGAGGGDGERLRAVVSEMMRLHMPREMLAVTTADAGAGDLAGGGGAAGGGAGGVAHGQLGVVDDRDPRVPPAGAMGTEASVRVWPWMCVARGVPTGAGAGGGGAGVRGFVWRDGVARAEEVTAGGGVRPPLLVVGGGGAGAVGPSVRMTWLAAGLNDAAMLGLLEKRSDPAVVDEVLAGVVGRTGVTGAGVSGEGHRGWPVAPAGFLYAGWPTGREFWAQVPPMLERLVAANDPGRRVQVAADDPVYLAAKLWLAKSRRPAARVAGYTFGLRPGRNGDVVDARVELLAENPVAAAAEMDVRFLDLPGDFDVAPAAGGGGGGGDGGADAPGQAGRRTARVPAEATGRVVLPMAGHLDSVVQAPGLQRLEITERHGGAAIRVPVGLPLYRTRPLENAPKLDGAGEDWPVDTPTRVFGEMKAGLRYLTRPDLTGGVVREDPQPAAVRWSYDADYLYVYARCPQPTVTDERNTEWPVEGRRWWGADGLQVQVADVASVSGDGQAAGARVVQVAFKPAGVMLVKTGRLSLLGREGAGGGGGAEGRVIWTEGPPAGMGGAVRYGIVVERRDGRVTGWAVEAAIPRAWVPGRVAPAGEAAPVKRPAWRVNVLRHRAGDLASMSWSGPVVDDEDLGMMGLLVGE